LFSCGHHPSGGRLKRGGITDAQVGRKAAPRDIQWKLVGIITDTDLVSGSSLGLSDVLSGLLEMHRESIHLGESREWCEGFVKYAASSPIPWIA